MLPGDDPKLLKLAPGILGKDPKPDVGPETGPDCQDQDQDVRPVLGSVLEVEVTLGPEDKLFVGSSWFLKPVGDVLPTRMDGDDLV